MPENVACYPQRDISGAITGVRLFLKQIKEQHPLPYPQAEWCYLTLTVPEVLDAFEASLKREAEKDAEIERLKSAPSRPESDYSMNFDKNAKKFLVRMLKELSRIVDDIEVCDPNITDAPTGVESEEEHD